MKLFQRILCLRIDCGGRGDLRGGAAVRGLGLGSRGRPGRSGNRRAELPVHGGLAAAAATGAGRRHHGSGGRRGLVHSPGDHGAAGLRRGRGRRRAARAQRSHQRRHAHFR